MNAPWKEWIPGALTNTQVKALIDADYVENADRSPIDYSSFDLTLDDECWEMIQGSVKPFGGGFSNFLDTETEFARRHEAKDGIFSLSPKKTYLFKLKERLAIKLKDVEIHGQATAKSSVGRVDVLARLIVDGMSSYEGFDRDGMKQSSGQMYVEVTSMTFAVNVKVGTSLSQLRLFYGRPEECEMDGRELYQTVLLKEDRDSHDNCLRVDLTKTQVMGHEVSAFRAKRSCHGSIDLWKQTDHKRPNPLEFWDFDASDKSNRLPITAANFYIMRSKERMCLPRGVCVYCRAIDETIGEMRIHYAGFVHPFFGCKKERLPNGTPLIFEVRGHDVNVILSDNEKLAKLTFYRMSEDCSSSGNAELSSYNDQTLELSKFFDEFPAN